MTHDTLQFTDSSGKFWHLWPTPGYEKIVFSKVKLKTFAEVKQVVEFAYLDEDLFEFLQEPPSRSSLATVLVAHWFSRRFDLVEEISRTDKFKKVEDRLKLDNSKNEDEAR